VAVEARRPLMRVGPRLDAVLVAVAADAVAQALLEEVPGLAQPRIGRLKPLLSRRSAPSILRALP
jgi:hypothetical protein